MQTALRESEAHVIQQEQQDVSHLKWWRQPRQAWSLQLRSTCQNRDHIWYSSFHFILAINQLESSPEIVSTQKETQSMNGIATSMSKKRMSQSGLRSAIGDMISTTAHLIPLACHTQKGGNSQLSAGLAGSSQDPKMAIPSP